MSDVPNTRMTVDEYLVWAEAQPGRHELVNGRVIAMAPERVRHGKTKFSVQLALFDAIQKAGKPCEVFPDGRAATTGPRRSNPTPGSGAAHRSTGT